MNFTINDIKKSKVWELNPHLEDSSKVSRPKGKSKYLNNKKEVDGILFHSEKEAKYYSKLKLLLKAGVIGLLELQVPYELNEKGEFSYKYIADFTYYDSKTGEKSVIDVKGFKTREYLKKKRLMKKVHGITIIEV